MSGHAIAKVRRASCGLLVVGMLSGRGSVDAQNAPIRTPIPSVPNPSISPFIAEAAQRFGIPSMWITAVMRVESAGYAHALSPKGAMGLMQIMPQTWSVLRARYNLGADPFDPRDNILAGAGYLRELFDRYGQPGFLAAYNAGPGRWEDHLSGARSLPNETIDYVAKLAPAVGSDADAVRSDRTTTAHSAPALPSIFVARSNDPSIANAISGAGLWPISRVKVVVSSVSKLQPNALFIALTPKGSAQ